MPPPGPPLEVIQRCLAGDQAAWTTLVDSYSGLLYAIARAHGLDEPTCDDVVQAAFIALYRHLGSIRDPSQLASWLGQTARRECWRIARARPPAGPDRAEPVFLPDERLEALEQRHALRAAFEGLDPRCQTLLRTLFGDAHTSSYDEIADRLAMPVGSIGPTRRRCLAKLWALASPDPHA